MAYLGSILLFEAHSAFRSGAAFSLASTPRTDASVELPGAQIEVRAGQRDVVVRFDGAASAEGAFSDGHRLAQQGLDLLSVLGRCDAVIQDAEAEHLIWWVESDGVVLRQVSTHVLAFAVQPISLVGTDTYGNVIPVPAPVPPQHHMGFRYYRLAQTTEDLYDAYRNMYLAFEVLLSSQCPKPASEREQAWLVRALGAAQATIRLDDLVPAQGPDVIPPILSAVYKKARLPLFHAKEGNSFYPPQDSAADREAVSHALRVLTRIVLRMAEAWFSARHMEGGVYHAPVYNSIKQLLAQCSMVALNYSGPFLGDDGARTHERFQSAVELSTRLISGAESAEGPAILGMVAAKDLKSLEAIRRIEVVDADQAHAALMFEAPLVCDDAARFEVLMGTGIRNLNQPKSLFRQ